VTQTVRDTEISIVYNRPVARGRALFGSLVKSNVVWNPGANEATTVEVSHDVLIENQKLDAGRYSL
jgi:hypothetical protein